MKSPLDLSPAALYEQLAEEAAELAHAAQKMARKLRGENPTPVTEEFIRHSVWEEYNDVLNTASYVGLCGDIEFQREKSRRWIERLNENP